MLLRWDLLFQQGRTHNFLTWRGETRERILKMGNLTLCFGGTQKLEKTGFKDAGS